MIEKTPNTVTRDPPINAAMLLTAKLIMRPALTRKALMEIINKPFLSLFATSKIFSVRFPNFASSDNMDYHSTVL